MAPKIEDVAKLAGVSMATVSRVLRGDTRISGECSSRVLAAAKEISYVPLRKRKSAKDPGGLKSRTFALLFLGMARSLEQLPVIASVIHGAESAVSQTGASLVLRDIVDFSQVPSILEPGGGIDGLILKGAMQGPLVESMGERFQKRLRALPAVWLVGKPDGAWGDVVGADDFKVGKLAAERLIAAGHRNIAYLNPKGNHVVFARRQAGFCWTAQEKGATVHNFVEADSNQWKLPLEAVRRVDSVAKLVDSLLGAKPKITAVYVPADNISQLVYRALASRSVKIGKGLSIISSNNEITVRDALFPELTTIDIHAPLIGERAVEQLLSRVANSSSVPTPEISISIDPSLVEGASVANVA